MRKVLVLGSTGMLGHQVVLRLTQNPDFEVFDLSFRNKFREETIICDVTDFKKLGQVIEDIQPHFIVNCIGILIKGSNENPKNSILINAYLPHFLTGEGDKIGAKVIHISTDCVFSGKKGAYQELDFRDADDVYGRGKALGEIYSEKHLTLRTSIIGPELKRNGECLFHWFMMQTGKVNGFSEAFWGGVTTLQLAKSIEVAINNNLYGLLHVSNGEKISKLEILGLFKRIWKKDDVEIQKLESKVIDKSLQISNSFDFNIPSYEIMFKELYKWMLENQEIYETIYRRLIRS
jgi:dTDP-4-dehydrorhamnose reductase